MEPFNQDDQDEMYRVQGVNPNWFWWYSPGPWFFPIRPRPPVWGPPPHRPPVWGPPGPWMPPRPPRPRHEDDSTFM